MGVSLQHNDFNIEVFVDNSFNYSTNTRTHYDNVYQHEKDRQYQPVSQHGIVVHKDNVKFASAILLAAAGATSVTNDSVIIDDNNLITRCCNIVFSLTLPDLKLNWMTQVDQATCFSIHKYQDDFISYGEMSITRIDKNGRIIWKHNGADIFVSSDGSSPFDMYEDHISMKDFNGSTYRIDYDGNTIEYKESDYHKQEPITVILKTKKPWWKFW